MTPRSCGFGHTATATLDNVAIYQPLGGDRVLACAIDREKIRARPDAASLGPAELPELWAKRESTPAT